MMSRPRARLGLLPFALAAFVVGLFPFYWAIVTSLRTGAELYSVALLPRHPTLENYRQAILTQSFLRALLNSALVATLTVALASALGTLAGFALARRSFRGRAWLLRSFLFISIFPQISLLSGLFELIRWMGLYNRWPALVLSYMIFSIPFTAWTLTTFLKQIPRELEEAAVVDGAGTFALIGKVFLPLLGPALATTGILTAIAAWNEFLFALTFTLSEQARTVPVAIANLSGASEFELPWGSIMAASVTVTIPLVAVIALFQRRIVAGLTAGGVKG
jgi:trehalose/maltose transport system permease protein